MNDYLLFIDTETSGLPKKWNLPYSDKDNWPCSIQIAWIIYSKDGEEITRKNYFINENDFSIEESSLKIHGITHDFLSKNGVRRKKVMNKLAYDIKKYRPMIIGHFMELDYHMINADFHRSGIQNPTKNLPLFCTMLASTKYVKNPQHKFLKLAELYDYLFNEKVENIHDAAVDAQITALSFFKLLKKGDITDDIINNQQDYFMPKNLNSNDNKWTFVFFLSFMFLLAILAL